MGAWAYCTNEDCQRGFDRPSFAEIIARKRECPACGHINRVGDDLGDALDEKFAEITELLTAGSQPVAVADDELPGLWQASDLSGGATDCNVAAGTIVPPQSPLVVAAGQEANTVPQLVGTLTYSVGDVAELRLADGVTLPPGYYTVSLTKEH